MTRLNAPGTENSAVKTARGDGTTLKERLETLVEEMVERGILFADACDEFERHYINVVLQRHGGNLLRTAEELRIHRNTLRKRLQTFAGKSKTRDVARRPKRAGR
jgi:DNA-binding NtrC family response regulator